ncbi:MAG: deoxyribonuclease V [Phycisphaerae bacterium]
MKHLYRWNLSYQDAIALQEKLAGRVIHKPLSKTPKLIAGIDCALTSDKHKIIACIVVLSYPSLEMLEIQSAKRKLSMPYIPGLLSFREAPACIQAAEKLKIFPDLFIVDGQGIAHPRRLGLAAHLGLFLDKPTIGCAKSRLIGNYNEPALRRGSFSLLKDDSETIGAVVRTKTNVKPLFLSVGHKCTLDDAIEWTLNCAPKFRLPEPTRLADIEVAKLK